MIIQTSKQLKIYRKAANLSTSILKQLIYALKPGIYPIEIDNLAKQLCRQNQVQPAFEGVGRPGNLYQYATCVSVNNTAVHGAPSSTIKLKEEDIVSVDFGIVVNNLYTDHCVTVAIKKLTPSTEKLIRTAKKSVLEAVAKATPGNTIGDLGHTMHSIAKSEGFDVLKQYTGHGIGLTLHESPNIPAHGQPGTGDILKKGQVICIEDQLVTGSDQVYVDKKDNWSVKTTDNGNSAMFEYMVVVGKNPEILTQTMSWPIVI